MVDVYVRISVVAAFAQPRWPSALGAIGSGWMGPLRAGEPVDRGVQFAGANSK